LTISKEGLLTKENAFFIDKIKESHYNFLKGKNLKFFTQHNKFAHETKAGIKKLNKDKKKSPASFGLLPFTTKKSNTLKQLATLQELGLLKDNVNHLVGKKSQQFTLGNGKKGIDSFLSFFERYSNSKRPSSNSKANILFNSDKTYDREAFFKDINSKRKVALDRTNIIVRHRHSRTENASLLIQNISRFIIAFIKKKRGSKNKFNQLKNVTYRILQTIKKHKLSDNDGIGFTYSGRAYGAKKAASFKIFLGSVPFSTLTAEIDYSSMMQKTKNGT
jgi:hypothetical protein